MIKSSIIILTAGRVGALKMATQSILAIDPDHFDAEIIIVDNNMSQDSSAEVATYCDSLAGKVRYVRESSPGLTAARHRGAVEAKGDILTFLDDDVEVSSTWLPAIQRGFSDPAVAIVGGPSIPKFACSIPAWLWSYMGTTPYGGWSCSWLSLLDIGHDVSDINPDFIWGLNFSIRKEVMMSCGGFHPDILPKAFQRWQGDGETGLTRKFVAAGYRADYIQEALLNHLCSSDRLTQQSFAKRAYYQGICNSFTSIRAGKSPIPASDPEQNYSRYQKLRFFVGQFLRRYSNCSTLWAKVSAPIKAATDEAYLDGWRFHQSEVAADPKLMAWVRRNDYWDADIREEMK